MYKKLLFVPILFFIINSSFSSQATYEGSKRCRMCHKGLKAGMVYEKWEDSEHSKAYEDLNEEERKNPFCLKCHVTGYNEPPSPGIRENDLLGVQCEACHGAGSLYKKLEIMNEDEFRNNFSKQREKALEFGLIIPNEDTCKKCHNKESPHYKPFIFKVAYPKIRHLLPRRYLNK